MNKRDSRLLYKIECIRTERSMLGGMYPPLVLGAIYVEAKDEFQAKEIAFKKWYKEDSIYSHYGINFRILEVVNIENKERE